MQRRDLNHRELREKLRVEHGIEVTKGSDAPVLPHLHVCNGPDFVELGNDMFAIYGLDGRDRSGRIHRDRLGKVIGNGAVAVFEGAARLAKLPEDIFLRVLAPVAVPACAQR